MVLVFLKEVLGVSVGCQNLGKVSRSQTVTAIGYALCISNLCSQLRTTSVELCHVNFSLLSVSISPLNNEIKTLFLLVRSKSGRHKAD